MLFHDFRRIGLQDGIGVIANQLEGIATSTLFVAGRGRPSSPKTCRLRDLFTTGPGPDIGGSKPGKKGWDHIPEKSGMGETLCTPMILTGPVAGPTACPQAGIAGA